MRFLLGLWLFAFSGPAVAQTILMGAIGDSGTVGLSAETPLAGDRRLWCVPYIIRQASTLARLPRGMRKLEIDALFERDASGLVRPRQTTYDNRYRWSWATGRNIASYSTRLEEKLRREGHTLHVANVAQVGAKSHEFLQQARDLVSLQREGNYDALGFVTVLASVNDALGLPLDGSGFISEEDVTEAYFTMLKALTNVHQADPVRVVIIPMMNLADLGHPEVRNRRVLPFLSAEAFRSFSFHRAFIYWSSWKTEAEYQTRVGQIQSFNRGLHLAVRMANEEERGRLEIVLLDHLFSTPLSAEFISVDAAHPSHHAHSALAEAAWNGSPWSR